ncbi:eukaryotic translation initiation factor 1b [Sigmodon hispidus]
MQGSYNEEGILILWIKKLSEKEPQLKAGSSFANVEPPLMPSNASEVVMVPAGSKGHSHVRIQQRNDKETPTTVQRVTDDHNKKKLVKSMKKKFACNDTVIEHPVQGEGIQLQDVKPEQCHFCMRLHWLQPPAEGA